MQKEPLVSFSIVTFNRCEKLKKALDSVINQTYKNLEIIIADNHSEDGTEELCREYAAKDPRIKYFRHNENLGMTANANFAVKQATGKYFFGLCDDDWLDLDFIEKYIDFANVHPDYTMTVPLAKIYDEDYNFIHETKGYKIDQNSMPERVRKLLEIYSSCVWSGLCRMDIVRQMLDCDDVIMKNRLFEDWGYTLKFIIAGKVAFIDNTYFHKLQGGWTKDVDSTKILWDRDESEEISYKNFWDKLGRTLLDSISKDNFFKLYLDEKSEKKLVKAINRVILTRKISQKIDYVSQKIDYVKRNPFFIFTKGFWIRTRQRIKKLIGK